MEPTDIAGATYHFLVNGLTPAMHKTYLFKPGDKLRLRFINASAMTHFDVRMPGLKMRVISADGQAVKPVDVEAFRIAVAETYDVLVELRYEIKREFAPYVGFDYVEEESLREHHHSLRFVLGMRVWY